MPYWLASTLSLVKIRKLRPVFEIGAEIISFVNKNLTFLLTTTPRSEMGFVAADGLKISKNDFSDFYLYWIDATHIHISWRLVENCGFDTPYPTTTIFVPTKDEK